jgi:hypothetical protein
VRDDWTTPVAQVLGRPIYGLDCQCSESFIQFNARHDREQNDRIPERLARAVSVVRGAPPLLIYSSPLGRPDVSEPNRVGLHAFAIADFRGSESGENYLIYRIEPIW